jgi:cation diffusion facilitator CzcD-associated flavoprotein CzcO
MLKEMMMQNLPNVTLVIGYTNISWTLGANVTGILLCRIPKHLKKRGSAAVVSRVPKSIYLEKRKMLKLNSTCVSKAENDLPKTAQRWPWQLRNNYLLGIIHVMYGRVNECLYVIV